MSVASWVVMLWKARLALRAGRRCGALHGAVWQSPSLDVAPSGWPRWIRRRWWHRWWRLRRVVQPSAASVAHAGCRRAFVATAHARAARCLHGVLGRLQYGQVLLATVGCHRPVCGPAGHVGHLPCAHGAGWGGQVTIDRLSGPVGEALVMTAAGLAVAIPAVLAYNVFGRLIGRIEADLEGFALDLRSCWRARPGPA